MNIFVLDENPFVSATMIDCVRLPKMITESAQMMAQDLEKSKAGDKMVEEVEGVKTIPKGFGEVLAAMANLNERLSKLEKK